MHEPVIRITFTFNIKYLNVTSDAYSLFANFCEKYDFLFTTLLAGEFLRFVAILNVGDRTALSRIVTVHVIIQRE